MTVVPVGCLVGCLLAAGPVSVPDLLPRLASPDPLVRQAAQDTLFRLDTAHLPDLQAALGHPDPEVRRWLREAVDLLQSRQRTDKLLTTRTVRLRYANAPLAEALADAAEQTGIALNVPELPVERRFQRLTLDTGETTPWEALYRVLDAAGLRPEPAQYVAPVIPEEEPNRARMRFLFARRGRAMLPSLETWPLRLLDEPPPEGVARFVRGPLCIEAGPIPGTRVEYPQPWRELELPLTFQVEPRYVFRGIASVTLDELRDEQGQRLPPVVHAQDPTLAIDYFTIPKHLDEAERGRWWYRRTMTLPIRTLARPSRSLTIRGRAFLGLLGPPEELARVRVRPNELPPATPTADGGLLRVSKAENDGEGTWSIEVTLTHPENGSWVGIGTENLYDRAGSTNPIRLLDRSGRPLRLAGGIQDNRNERVSLIRASYVALEEQDGPVTLTYTGRRPFDVEVPFELRGPTLP